MQWLRGGGWGSGFGSLPVTQPAGDRGSWRVNMDTLAAGLRVIRTLHQDPPGHSPSNPCHRSLKRSLQTITQRGLQTLRPTREMPPSHPVGNFSPKPVISGVNNTKQDIWESIAYKESRFMSKYPTGLPPPLHKHTRGKWRWPSMEQLASFTE